MVVDADTDFEVGVELIQPFDPDEFSAIGVGEFPGCVFSFVDGHEGGRVGGDLCAKVIHLTCGIHRESLQDENADGD